MDAHGGDDSEVVRELYGRYRRPLLGYVLQMVGGDYAYAEDVVQETLLRAWRNSDRVAVDDAGPWLHTVARNLVISGYRRRVARPVETPLADQDFPTADTELDRVLQSWQLAEVIRSLSKDHLRVIIELYYRRRSVSEAAEVLGIPVGTVKSRSYYALHALRAALEERGVTGP